TLSLNQSTEDPAVDCSDDRWPISLDDLTGGFQNRLDEVLAPELAPHVREVRADISPFFANAMANDTPRASPICEYHTAAAGVARIRQSEPCQLRPLARSRGRRQRA